MTFPIQNIVNILRDDGSFKGYGKSGANYYAEIVVRHLRFFTYIALAVLYNATFDLQRAATWKTDWVAFLWLRNMALGLFFYGGWHVFLYEIPKIREKLYPLKFNRRWPSYQQHRRDAFWTTSGLTISTAFEACMLHAFASGAIPSYLDFWSHPAWSIAHLFVIPYFRDFHFFWVHRLMHPWRIEGVPDVGQWLYNRAHYLHHKSYNTGPLSGLSMHPIEHIIYYTCTLLPLVFTLHPLHFYMNKLHADISPVSGHDGFDQPAGGSHFHYLHHAHYDCNYGTPMMPFDRWFGTYNDGKGRSKTGAAETNKAQ